MPEVTIREYRDMPLAGGTLLVSVPQEGLGNILLTDHLLDRCQMDHVAALDSDAFPPIAMVRQGKARFPLRVHADPATRVAVLRGEFALPGPLARPFVRAVLGWARRKGFARVVSLDAVRVQPDQDEPAEEPRLWFLASREATRRAAQSAGLAELPQGVIAGAPAVLLLEARFQDVDALALLAEVRNPIEDARSGLAFARALPRFVPKLDVDAAGLERELARVERTIQGMMEEATRALERMEKRAGKDAESAMYG